MKKHKLAGKQEMKTIKIECEGKENLKLSVFHEIQGNLKELTQDNFDKLKQSILKYGFSFPIFCWKDNNKKHWILDAHQRTRVLTILEKEGYSVPPLPTVYVHAKDKIEAKEKLLMLNSSYGKMTDEGLYEFLNEPGFELDLSDFDGMLEFPDVDMDVFKAGEPESENEEPEGENGNEHFKKIELSVPEETYNAWIKLNEKMKNILNYDNKAKVFEFAVIEALNIPDESLET